MGNSNIKISEEHNVAENTNTDQGLALFRQQLDDHHTRQFDKFSNRVANIGGVIRNLAPYPNQLKLEITEKYQKMLVRTPEELGNLSHSYLRKINNNQHALSISQMTNSQAMRNLISPELMPSVVTHGLLGSMLNVMMLSGSQKMRQ